MFGIGFRSPHLPDILEHHPKVDFFEAISENFMGLGRAPKGRPLENLLKVRKLYPICLHGVSLSIGSSDPINSSYLTSLKALARILEPMWISDHLCWTGVGGRNGHDLFPLPYTRAALRHVSRRIIQVQDFLGQRLVIENVSSYVSFRESEMSEWEFLCEVSESSDCEILLDINNVYVSSFNHGFDPVDYLKGIPKRRVRQFHIAGHQGKGAYKIDTHGEAVSGPVWKLYRKAVQIFGPVPLILERDSNIPPLGELLKELRYAKKIITRESTKTVSARAHGTSAKRKNGNSSSSAHGSERAAGTVARLQ